MIRWIKPQYALQTFSFGPNVFNDVRKYLVKLLLNGYAEDMGIEVLPGGTFCYVKGAFFFNNPVFDKKTKHKQAQKNLKAIACKVPKLGYLKHHSNSLSI